MVKNNSHWRAFETVFEVYFSLRGPEYKIVTGHFTIANFADDSDYRDAVVQTYSRTKPRDGWNAHAFGR